ncbi:MAG TPA: YdcF family protein [Candidatus Bathyarchaeia archaeon]
MLILFLIVFIVIVSSLIIFRDRIFSAIGNYLIIQDVLRPADVIHVIAGDDYRTDYAIQLYQEGLAKTIFFTGGLCKYHGYYHGEHGLELALSLGVPGEAVAIDDTSVMSTYDEAVLLKKYLDENQPTARTIIVVSDPFHMRRVRWTYQHIFGKGYEVILAPVPFDQTPLKPRWWTDPGSKQYVLDEYKKLVYYFFRYQLSMNWLSVLDKY